jgi:hypothetical protein
VNAYDIAPTLGSALECEPATHCVLRFASAGSQGSTIFAFAGIPIYSTVYSH